MKNKYLSILLVVIFISACTKDHMCDCFKNTGEIIKERREIASFDKIILNSQINLFLIQDSGNYVEVECGKKLINGIKTDVENGILTLKNTNKCNWMRSYKYPFNVYCHFTNFKKIEYNSSGNIKALGTQSYDTIQVDLWDGTGSVNMDVLARVVNIHIHTSPADVNISGNCNILNVYNRGEGTANCLGLNAENVWVDWRSTNDCYVNTPNNLSAQILYLGNVFYTGNPKIGSLVESERGRLIKLGN